MIGELPTSLVLGGKCFPIRTDFRVILRIFAAWNDPALTDAEKCAVCLLNLYEHPEDITPDIAQEAVLAAYRFCAAGEDIGEDAKPPVRLFDWVQDERILFPAVNKAAGYETRAVPYLHWWAFVGLLGEIGEGLFSTVLHIRSKRAEGKSLDKWEADFAHKHHRLIALHTPEEQAAIAETEAFLKTIL
jgi:hypothetical protein